MHVEELELEALGVRHPRRDDSIRSARPAFDVLAGHEVGEAHDAAADAAARLDDGHVVPGARQLVGRGEPAESGADDDDTRPACASTLTRSLSEQARGSREARLEASRVA